MIITEAQPLADPGPKIIFANEAFLAQTGYSLDEVLGKTPRILQGPLTDQSELRRTGHLLRLWQPVYRELINYTKAGQAFCVEMHIVPIADGNGKFTHWVSIQRDVTACKTAERERYKIA